MVLSGAFISGFIFSPELNVYLNDARAPLSPYGAAWTLLERDYYGEMPSREVRMRGAILGMLSTLNDAYTVLVPPQSARQEQNRLSGEYSDIGVSLWWDVDGGIGVSPYPDSPALKAGLREGDKLLAIDGTSVLTGTPDLNEIQWRLQGKKGTDVLLDIYREPDEYLSITVTRDDVLHPSVQWRTIETDAGIIGYISISMVTNQTAKELETAMAELMGQHIQDVVLDLRDNYGGVTATLPHMAGVFLPGGAPLYYEVNRGGEETIYVKENAVAQFNGSLSVIVNQGTASAAEILAGALQDYARAELIGQVTYGKGSIQSLYTLQDGSSLHITSAIWLTPERQKLDGKGLQPDIEVEAQLGKDMQLETAIETLSRRD